MLDLEHRERLLALSCSILLNLESLLDDYSSFESGTETEQELPVSIVPMGHWLSEICSTSESVHVSSVQRISCWTWDFRALWLCPSSYPNCVQVPANAQESRSEAEGEFRIRPEKDMMQPSEKKRAKKKNQEKEPIKAGGSIGSGYGGATARIH